jgi:hypothetical protein
MDVGADSVRKQMMTRSEKSAVARATLYEDMPFLELLFRYVWPFWLFKDASRGDRNARAAAYRHNRSMRVYLPGYLVKWVLGSLFAFALTAACESLGGAAAHVHVGPANIFAVMAAGGGIIFAGSLCVLFVTGYVYLYLGKHDY